VTRMPLQHSLVTHPLEPAAHPMLREIPQTTLRALPLWPDEPTVLLSDSNGQAPWYLSTYTRRQNGTSDPVIFQIISDAHLFDQLFDLLGSDDFAEEVWSILMILPKNEKYVQLVLNLGQRPKQYWSSGGEGLALFSGRNMYKLMYMLQIVEDVVCRAKTAPSNDWARNLIERGFLDHLSTLARAISTQAGPSSTVSNWLSSASGARFAVWRSCIALLCRVITRFVLLDPSMQYPSVISKVTSPPVASGVGRAWLLQMGTVDFLRTIIPCLSQSTEIDDASELSMQSEAEVVGGVFDCLLVMCSVTPFPDLLQILQSPEFVECIQCVLLRSHTRQIRLRSALCLEELAGLTSDKAGTRAALLATLDSLVPSGSFGQTSEAFFLLCVGLIPGAPVACSPLANTLLKLLTNHNSLERTGENSIDEWLIGCLRALRACVKCGVFDETARTALASMVAVCYHESGKSKH